MSLLKIRCRLTVIGTRMSSYIGKLAFCQFLFLAGTLLPIFSHGQTPTEEVIGGVVSKGSTAFTHQQLLTAYFDLIGRPANDANLDKLRNQIVALYGEAGYYLPQVTISKDSTTANVFEATIQEPVIQSFSLNGGNNNLRQQTGTLLNNLMGNSVYSSEQFNNLKAFLSQQLQADVVIKPQHIAGTTGDFHLNIDLSGRTDFEVTVSNEGSDRLGKETLAANLRLMDIIPGVKEFYLTTFNTLRTDGYRSLGTGISLAISERNEIFLDTNVSRARLEVDAQPDVIFDKQNYSLGWRFFISEADSSGNGISASLLGRDFQQSQTTDDIDEALRIIDIGYWSYQIGGSFAASWSLNARQGLDAMGAQLSGPLADPNTDIDFSRINASLVTLWQFPRQWALRIDTTAQYSGDNLPFSQRYAIASNATARAYESGELSGDSGLGVQFEVRRYLNIDSLRAQWIPYCYYGVGRVKDNLTDDSISGASIGIGSRFLGDSWSGYIEVGKPLIEESVYRTDTPRAQASLSYRF